MEEKLDMLREQCRREEELRQKREDLRAQRNLLEKELLELSMRRSKECRDVKDLEGLTMTSILSFLSGTKQKKLEKEQREAEAAALEAEKAELVLKDLEKELRRLNEEIQRLRGSKQKYENALKEKAARMEAMGKSTGFLVLQEKLGRLETESNAVTDALQLGNALRTQLNRILEILQSARNWGRLDMFGGGSASSALKRDRMEQTRKALAELDVILKFFRGKCKGTLVFSQVSSEKWGEDLFAADFLLDGMVIDALVQVDILDCIAEMERLREQTEEICIALRQEADSIREQKETLQKEWLNYLETME